METERLPPQSREAEVACLGSMLRDNEAIADVASILHARDFYQDAHQRIFTAILEQWERGSRADLVTTAEALKSSGDIDNIGGYAYLAELWDASPTAANAEYYAKIVQEKALARNCIRAATQILRWGYEGMPGGELVEKAEQEMFQAGEIAAGGQTFTIGEIVEQAANAIEQRAATGKQYGIPTGLLDADAIICGLVPSLVLVGARPSVGKTSLAATIALNVAKTGRQVLFVSLEQGREELGERLLCMQAEVDSHHVKTAKLTEQEWVRLSLARDILTKLPLQIDDISTQTVTRIAANTRRCVRRHKVQLLVIDYLQLIEPEDKKVIREQQVASITRRLKLLARDIGIPIVLLAQLNRGPEEGQRRRPRLSDLRESGSQEQDADVVILLHRTEEKSTEPVEAIDCIVGKNRNGRTGDCVLGFRKACMRFESLEPVCLGL